MFKRIEFYRFFIYNFLAILVTLVLYYYFFNGSNNDFPYDLVFYSVLISVPIIILQYPILHLRKNWFYRSFVLYLSMIVFLFVYGVVLGWSFEVGGREAGSWIGRIDSGVRMMIFGQIFGGLAGYGAILIFNYAYKDKLFINNKAF